MTRFMFLMQHTPTPEQLIAAAQMADEVIIMEDKSLLMVPEKADLTYDWFKSRAIIMLSQIGIPGKGDTVHFMGQGQLASAVNAAARMLGAATVESVTTRKSVDEPQADGSVRKTSVFQFCGFRAVYSFHFSVEEFGICGYCGSDNCVAVKYGESICGYDHSVDRAISKSS